MLEGRNVLLGITGSIAAYKAALLTRLLIKRGASVKVIMTKAASDFISPLTLSTLSQNKVYTDISSEDEWSNHVDLGLWADIMLIAPATANTLSKMAAGAADNMLIATYLSAKSKVFFAPAMDLDMWKHPANQKNIQSLLDYGHQMIDVGDGFLASGLEGKGRMAEPEEIIEAIESYFSQNAQLKDQKVLITAGPTNEPIDPVRFIGNHSSGKMGYALAKAALGMGAEVHLIIGPHSLNISSHPKLSIYPVQTAQQMFDQAIDLFGTSNIAIMAAAVADYRPKSIAQQKLKKKNENLQLELERTPDIAYHLGQVKRNDQKLIGFALETNNELENAQKKLHKKNFDWIVLNSLNDEGAGFKGDTNKVTLIDKKETRIDFPLQSKDELAFELLNQISEDLEL